MFLKKHSFQRIRNKYDITLYRLRFKKEIIYHLNFKPFKRKEYKKKNHLKYETKK